MIKPLFNQFLQHLMAQNPAIAQSLQPLAGKHIAIQMLLLQAKLCILENGYLAIAPDSATADAVIRLNPSTLLRLMSGDHHASQSIQLQGDSELATRFSQIIQQMRWDIEQDLSLVIGDIPAHQLAKFTRHSLQQGKQQAQNLAEMLVEYWQEEQPLLAKQRHVDAWIGAVDALRDDCARLEKRIQQLQKHMEQV
jgi:ubiquinone biosynthesis protein UbiJ